MKTTSVASENNTSKIIPKRVNQKADQSDFQVKGTPEIDVKVAGDNSNNEADANKEQLRVHSPAQASVNNGAITQEGRVQPAPAVTNSPAMPSNQPTPGSTAKPELQRPLLNLESTLKLVEELHRRKIQRDRLLETIETLEAFEIAQQEDAEETDANHFQSCVLTIEDDNRRKFTTKNPVIIQAVAQFVNKMCVDRLAEIEAGITIPA
ncbi:hypothetical protein [Pedobacter sp. SYP-B3415]|uniref:hypothetical protein n=1 Tax=Pedobacter sp. SYP-B3415 TaxID=2496641 RepID=UPI00101DA916|nr:hypothetical protein [Pedobacter sp. SYP-B3415]